MIDLNQWNKEFGFTGDEIELLMDEPNFCIQSITMTNIGFVINLVSENPPC